MIWWMIAFAGLSLILWITIRPLPVVELESHSHPAVSYEEAIARIRRMQDEDNRDLTRDVCTTKLYDHGRQTDHVIILIHGFTNCPEQFSELGKQYYQAGNTVLIPRMPYHGLSDRLTNALVELAAEDLAAFGDQVVDIAHGLGRKVTVMGISGSGTLVAWLAQNRADIDFAFAIAPLFGLAFIPLAFTRLFERIVFLMPNFFLWWDPRTKAENPYSIYYAYPRYPTRALAEFLRLARITRAQAENAPPKAGRITMIINDSEPAVSNEETLRLIKIWRKHPNTQVSDVHFEKELHLPHDILTPGTPGLPIGDIYQRLMSAVRGIHTNHEPT